MYLRNNTRGGNGKLKAYINMVNHDLDKLLKWKSNSLALQFATVARSTWGGFGLSAKANVQLWTHSACSRLKSERWEDVCI